MTKEITTLTEHEAWSTLDNTMKNCSSIEDVNTIGSLIRYIMDRNFDSPNGKNIFDYQFDAVKLAKQYSPQTFKENKAPVNGGNQ